MLVDNKFNVGDYVYLKTDTEQIQRLVTGITIDLNGGLTYTLVAGVEQSFHYDLEMTKEKNYV